MTERIQNNTRGINTELYIDNHELTILNSGGRERERELPVIVEPW